MSSDNQKSNIPIIVAIISLAGAISVPFINHYLDSQKVQVQPVDPTRKIQDSSKYFENELDYLERLDNEIQSGNLSPDQLSEKLNELGIRFTNLIHNVNDCKIGVKIYRFGKQKLEPHYKTNDVFENGLNQIKEKCGT